MRAILEILGQYRPFANPENNGVIIRRMPGLLSSLVQFDEKFPEKVIVSSNIGVPPSPRRALEISKGLKEVLNLSSTGEPDKGFVTVLSFVETPKVEDQPEILDKILFRHHIANMFVEYTYLEPVSEVVPLMQRLFEMLNQDINK